MRPRQSRGQSGGDATPAVMGTLASEGPVRTLSGFASYHRDKYCNRETQHRLLRMMVPVFSQYSAAGAAAAAPRRQSFGNLAKPSINGADSFLRHCDGVTRVTRSAPAP